MKYKCWCEWLKDHAQMSGGRDCCQEARDKRREDMKHHAFLEGRKLPTVEELKVQLEGIIFNMADFSGATAINPPKLPSNWAELAAQALITYLKERHE